MTRVEKMITASVDLPLPPSHFENMQRISRNSLQRKKLAFLEASLATTILIAALSTVGGK
jgi:hypothetical protein